MHAGRARNTCHTAPTLVRFHRGIVKTYREEEARPEKLSLRKRGQGRIWSHGRRGGLDRSGSGATQENIRVPWIKLCSSASSLGCLWMYSGVFGSWIGRSDATFDVFRVNRHTEVTSAVKGRHKLGPAGTRWNSSALPDDGAILERCHIPTARLPTMYVPSMRAAVL